MNNVYAIIVTYNPEIKLLNQQFLSLSEQVKGIVYVDNGSTNIEEIIKFHEKRPKLSNVNFIFNTENMGLGFAQNQGIKVAFEDGADHIVLLDHDSVLEYGFIEGLLTTEEQQTNNGIKVGLVGPIFFNSENGEQYPVILEKGFSRKKIRPKTGFTVVSFTIASGSLFSKEVLSDVGLMDEGLFVDFIDNEWCWRAQAKGYQIIVTANAKMKHQIGDRRITFLNRNMSSHSPQRRYYLTRNGIQAFRYKHVPMITKFGITFRNIIRLIIIVIKFPNRKEYLKYCWAGIVDGIKGVQGPCTVR